ncbi:hypothetical protein TELCIR_11151 [Teladorsagia circumcincta]|uniref:Uncharacterized protein n=1 Tax=Teladorsagia circumcincta TaxID=45464 RepID=A0A2G9UA69_TELCI|nr:hypothetical protein TELCIR_11151 [Teladorsagia circumcincta]
MSAVNITLIATLTVIMPLTLAPSPEFIEQERDNVMDKYNIDLTKKAFHGFSMKLRTISALAFLQVNCVLLLSLSFIGLLCAWKIDLWLAKNSISPQTRRMNRKMLAMLVALVGALRFPRKK